MFLLASEEEKGYFLGVVLTKKSSGGVVGEIKNVWGSSTDVGVEWAIEKEVVGGFVGGAAVGAGSGLGCTASRF